jgi:hypothetical protein
MYCKLHKFISGTGGMILRKIIVSMAAAFLLLYSLPVSAEKPGGVVSEEKTAIATVEAVNKDTREVTLKGEDGGTLTFIAGPEVRNFAQSMWETRSPQPNTRRWPSL